VVTFTRAVKLKQAPGVREMEEVPAAVVSEAAQEVLEVEEVPEVVELGRVLGEMGVEEAREWEEVLGVGMPEVLQVQEVNEAEMART
jgi:hypothetical protein